MESIFRGIHTVCLDSKGRLTVPVKYRLCLSKSVVVTMDLNDPCLLLYSSDEFNQIAEKINQLPSFNNQTKRLKRQIIGLASDVELDGQFRILIPPPLRKYVGIEKKIVMIGQTNKFEVWDEAQWNVEREQWKQQDEKMPEEMLKLSI